MPKAVILLVGGDINRALLCAWQSVPDFAINVLSVSPYEVNGAILILEMKKIRLNVVDTLSKFIVGRGPDAVRVQSQSPGCLPCYPTLRALTPRTAG